MTYRKPVILAVLLASLGVAEAQLSLIELNEQPEPETIDLPRYQVEIVVFRNYDPPLGTPELFEVELPPEPETPVAEESLPEDGTIIEDADIVETAEDPVDDGDIPIFTDADLAPPDEYDDEEVPVPPGFYELNNELFPLFEKVPDDRLQMTAIVEALTRRSEYEPVLHTAWTQYGYPREESEAYEVVNMPTYVEHLDGRVKLSLGRFLHLEVDLEMLPPVTVEPEVPPDPEETDEFGFGEQWVPYTPTVDELPRTKTLYTIKEDRIVRRNEYNYFDHPKFGVIALVIADEQETEDEELPDEDFLAPDG